MSITFPSTPGFQAIGLKMNDPTIIFRAQNGRRVARKVSGHLWTFTLSYPPTKRDLLYPVVGAIAKAQGQYQTFTVIPPNLANPSGTQISDTTVAASKVIGSTAIDLTGATIGSTFKAGDVIKFSNHTKVYMITDNAIADGSGNVTVNIVPPLVSAITMATHTAKHKDVPFTVALSNNIQEFKTNVAGFYSYELDVEEVF